MIMTLLFLIEVATVIIATRITIRNSKRRLRLEIEHEIGLEEDEDDGRGSN